MKIRKGKINKPALYSVGLSVLLHVLFISGASNMKVMYGQKIKPADKPRSIKVRLAKKKLPVKIKERIGKRIADKKAQDVVPLKFEQPGYMQSVMSFLDSEEKQLKKAEPTSRGEKFIEPFAARPKEIDHREREKDPTVLKKATKREAADTIVIAMNKPSDNLFAQPEELVDELIVPRDFVDKMPGYTPKLTEQTFDPQTQKDFSKVGRGYTSFVKRAVTPEDLNEVLLYQLSTYVDPETQEKYFKLSISVEAMAGDLPTLPKEIVFLVDCSISIDQKRLEQFKEGLKFALTHLNSDDYFNIMAFKERIIKFQPASVKVNDQNTKDALQFVEDLTIGEKTDTYSALLQTIESEYPLEPSYIVLLSDGRPTKGIVNSRELINKISQINQGRRPIFAFSGGVLVNRYLLDFISYKNRGWAEYAYRAHFMARNLTNMYKKIRDPIMLNLRYHISGVQQQEIFPRMLPDFFRSAEFTLYGKYSDENHFVMQLLGDVQGEAREFIVESSFDKAQPGDEEIARNWAFNKIYYLIGLLEHDRKNTKVIKEIKMLSKKFKIKTPYLKDILN